jgi:phosphoribosylformylglycinamidine synthase
MSEACRLLEIPVVSGNVRLYNETEGEAVYPTPVVGMVGLLPDAEKHCTTAFRDPGDEIVLLGELAPHLGVSEYLAVIHEREVGPVPEIDLFREKALQGCCRELIGRGLVKSAHDCAEGGLAVALAECCIARDDPMPFFSGRPSLA